jgi:RNase H-like domain found in reverse transcriptase
MKQLIAEAPTLQFFDVSKETIIQTDASSFAFGFTLMQNGIPISYASRVLTATERNYAQIEKETLAILFAARKFDQYICGKSDVIVETDHSPLIQIFSKPISQSPKRIQSMILCLQRYNLKLRYKKGMEMLLADTLSRAPSQSNQESSRTCEVYKIQEIEETCKAIIEVQITNGLRIRKTQIEKIKDETKKDEIAHKLMTTIQRGWPKDKTKLETTLNDFWPIRDSLATHEFLYHKQCEETC